MATHDDGGPAFPFAGVEGVWPAKEGMSLWDWFAGQALAGLIAGKWCVVESDDKTAETAYRMADAMISEKRRREGGAS